MRSTNTARQTTQEVVRPNEPPGADVDVDGPLRPDAGNDAEDPHWVWARVGDGGATGQEVWARYTAEDAPHGAAVLAAPGPSLGEPGARVVVPSPASPTATSPEKPNARQDDDRVAMRAPHAETVPSTNHPGVTDLLVTEFMRGLARVKQREPGLVKALLGSAPSDASIPSGPSHMTMEAYGKRVSYSKRTIESLVKYGLPCIGSGRARRVIVRDADEWLRTWRADEGAAIELEARAVARRGRHGRG